MITQATIPEILRYRRPRPVDGYRVLKEHERQECARGVSLGKSGGPGHGLSSVPYRAKDYFPTAFTIWQSDIAHTLGSTLLDTGGAGPVLTLTGALLGKPCAVWVRATLAGARGVWTYEISYDGGSSYPQTGTSAATVPLQGPGTGLTLNIAVGVAVLSNVWKATCSTATDQTTNGKHGTQATASAQPIVTGGMNGKPGLLCDGINDSLGSTAHTLLAFPYQIVLVARLLQPALASQGLCGTDGFSAGIYTSAANTIRQHCGSGVNPVAHSSTALTLFSATFTNSVADTMRVGANSTTGAAGGSTLATTASRFDLARWAALGWFANMEVFALILTPPTSLAAFSAALNTAQGYGVGSTLV